MQDTIEIWKDVVGYEGYYQVSNKGLIKSLHSRNFGNILVPSLRANGYLSVCLFVKRKRKTTMVHKIVAMAFKGHKPNGYVIVIDHIDNDKRNNNADNLAIISQKENNIKSRINRKSRI